MTTPSTIPDSDAYNWTSCPLVDAFCLSVPGGNGGLLHGRSRPLDSRPDP